MEKNKYRSIRIKNNFIYLYYLNEGGTIRNEKEFLFYFDMWAINYLGLPRSIAIRQIVSFLDRKNNYKP